MRYETRILILALFCGLPGVGLTLLLLWYGEYSAKVQITVAVFLISLWLGVAFALRDRVVFPLQTLSNLLAALREGDFSIKARGASYEDPLGAALYEVNSLSQTLRDQRMEALEATALLRTVMAEINVAVFAFDNQNRLKLVNRAGERLIGQPAKQMLGRSATEIGLLGCLDGESPRTIHISFPGKSARWEIRRSTFREQGIPHQLLVLLDVSRALREEERQAWQRLVRVLGHELNNSLTPIKSIAESLDSLLGREPLADDWRLDARRGLGIIGARAGALSRFLSSYSRLARLPQPRFQPLNIATLIRRVVTLETRLEVRLQPGPDLNVQADGDQLEQLLINVLRNAVDAAMVTGGGVDVGWSRNGAYVDVWVKDEGPGLANTSNLFVPFYTTKPGGSGIGLVLSRQIAEAHGGSLALENRSRGTGCEAHLRLPI